MRAYGQVGGFKHYSKQPEPEPFAIPHGTAKGYAYYGCRCDRCRLAAERGAGGALPDVRGSKGKERRE